MLRQLFQICILLLTKQRHVSSITCYECLTGTEVCNRNECTGDWCTKTGIKLGTSICEQSTSHSTINLQKVTKACICGVVHRDKLTSRKDAPQCWVRCRVIAELISAMCQLTFHASRTSYMLRASFFSLCLNII